MWEKLVDAIERKQVVKTKEMLRQSPEQVVAKNYQDETLLHFAAKAGDFDMAEFLLTRKADVNIRNDGGQTALDVADGQGGKDKLRELYRKHGLAR